MNRRYRILLTEASSASSREVLTVLGRQGHHVGVMDSGGLNLTSRSRWIAARHPSPRFVDGPARYLDALREVLAQHSYDIVLPTHEQLVALSRHRDEFGRLVAGLAVPDFGAVRKVQDKSVAVGLLDDLGLPQPETVLVADAGELRSHIDLLPAYVKLPVATASRGVWYAADATGLDGIAADPDVAATFAAGGRLLVQRRVDGPLVQIQALFDRGELAGLHTLLRTREGAQGSASAKESLDLPDVAVHMAKLGGALAWHGPLSIDAILDEETGTVAYIDVNPRLVEPVNAELAGADLVGRWLAVSLGNPTGPRPEPRAGVRTHTLLMAVLRHAELGHGRRSVLAELARAVTRRGWYARSTEELMPTGSDPATLLTLSLVTACLLLSPPLWKKLAGSGAPAHALSARGWHELTERGTRT